MTNAIYAEKNISRKFFLNVNANKYLLLLTISSKIFVMNAQPNAPVAIDANLVIMIVVLSVLYFIQFLFEKKKFS
jgi:hypothetical protein